LPCKAIYTHACGNPCASECDPMPIVYMSASRSTMNTCPLLNGCIQVSKMIDKSSPNSGISAMSSGRRRRGTPALLLALLAGCARRAATAALELHTNVQQGGSATPADTSIYCADGSGQAAGICRLVAQGYPLGAGESSSSGAEMPAWRSAKKFQ
jgi:hypothetical protein